MIKIQNISNKYIVAVLCLVLQGCGGGGGGEDDRKPVPGDYYDTALGSLSFDQQLTLRDRDSGNLIREEMNKLVDYVGISDSLPSKYQYMGPLSGPYEVEVEFDNGNIDGIEYSTGGTEVVDDELDTFTRVDTTTSTGTTELKITDLFVGQSLSFSEQATLYDSKTAAEVGSETISGTLSIIALAEPVSVAAGDFTTIKIGVTSTLTPTIDEPMTLTGFMWFRSTDGLPVKMEITSELTVRQRNVEVSLNQTLEVIQGFDQIPLGDGIIRPLSVGNAGKLDLTSLVDAIRLVGSAR